MLLPKGGTKLFRVFDALRQHVSIIIVEHNLDLVLALADRVFALERGTVIHQGPARLLLDDLAYRKKILWLLSLGLGVWGLVYVVKDLVL